VEGSWWNHLALRMAVILVVEDEEQVRVLAASYLVEQGHQVLSAGSPDGAIALFGSKADVTLLNFDVRFTPESGHSPTRSGCLLWARSRHPSLDHFVGERPGNERFDAASKFKLVCLFDSSHLCYSGL
jgi:hypothetical protein